MDMNENRQPDEFGEWMGTGERLSDLTVSSDGASREKAIDALDALAGRELVNTETGIKARVSTRQRKKIMSGVAIEKSKSNGFSAAQHFALAARLDKAWEHATLVKTRDDRNAASIKRFAAPLMMDGEPALAYITAKESVEHGHRIYSLELKEIKYPQSRTT